jgi:hypothetical protein
MRASITNRLGLTSGQTIMLMGIGAALWFLAAIILRIVASMGALEGSARAFTYVLIIPGTLPFVWLTQVLAKLRRDQIAIGVAVVTAAALLIDGFVVAWFPVIYGSALPQVTNCAAAILWGAGVGLVLAFFLNKETEI